MQHSAYLNTINFSNEESITVSKKTQFLKTLKSLTNLVAFYTNVLHFQILHNWKKTKNPSVFQKKPRIWAFRAVFYFRTHSTSNLLPLAFFNDFVFYFLKIHVFFSRKANFARFEKLYYFSRILRQICCFYRFLRFSFFFQKIRHLFKKKMNVLRKLKLSVAFYDKFAIFSDFQKFMFFLEKLTYIFL